MSTAEWTGVPLLEVLDRAGVKAGAREVVFRGADTGRLDANSEAIRFERSLSMNDARGSEALLAYAMNGEPLPIQHGYPLRLIVPSWYAVASVKWLTEIDMISEPFRGHYQTEAYFFEWQRGGELVREPVSLQRVRSLITEPEPGIEVEQDELTLRGVAWSGAAPIARVEVSIGGGPWQDARLPHMRMGLVHIQQGKYEAAIRSLKTAVHLAEQSTESLAALATAHAAAGNTEDTRTFLNELQKPESKRYVLPYNIAKIYSAAANPDKAFEWLEAAYKEGNPDLIELNSEPLFDSLRSDPRFSGLMQRVGRAA